MDKKTDEIIVTSDTEIELFTVADLKDGGYEKHYRKNIQSDSDNPHDNSKVNNIYDMKKMDYTEPFYKCPKCEGPNLYRALHEDYYECIDCEHLGETNDLKQYQKI